MASQPEIFHGPFSSLPVELRQAILCELPDIPALQAALEADASLQDAFSDAESHILDSIICHQIPVGLLPEAFALLASSRLDEDVQKILDSYLLRLPSYPIKWTLDEAQTLINTHELVSFFAEEFASSALRISPVASQSPAPLSINERSRVMGGFYRFELYCIFTEYPGLEDLFLKRFAPWENEQLASIYDYLFDRIISASPFGDVSMNEILSMGLGSLRQLITVSTHQESYRLVSNIHYCLRGFLPQAVEKLCRSTDDNITLSDYSEDMKRKHIDHPVLTDPDHGPRNAWYWTHADKYGNESIFFPRHGGLRLGGYVMWDNSRLLQEWDMFNTPLSELEREGQEYPSNT
ncbi:hypothetical protein FQN50_004914 [Emmonsiellopsis sp. PD_5]|nr:hypothetical protein FQN50_004914 [Emmonsiellopsis sp. PD_5]